MYFEENPPSSVTRKQSQIPRVEIEDVSLQPSAQTSSASDFHKILQRFKTLFTETKRSEECNGKPSNKRSNGSPSDLSPCKTHSEAGKFIQVVYSKHSLNLKWFQYTTLQTYC